MKFRLTIIFVILTLYTASSQDAKKDSLENDINAYAQMASSFLNEQNVDNLGGIISNLVQSEGGKQIGDMLMGMGNNKNTNQILQSLGSLISQTGGASGGFDPTILTSMLNVLQTSDTGGKREDGQDASSLLSTFGNLLGQEGGLENVMGVLPLLMNTVSSFTGDEAQKRIEDHASHSWYLPPVLEKLHLIFDHFMNSELGKSVMKSIGTEKFIKVFTDANGKFSFSKFIQLLENHSFRKHWIELVTRRIAAVVSYFADPKIQKRFLTTVQYFINSFLKSQGFPKSAMFDPVKPTETLSAFLNVMFKKYLGYKVNAKQYVKPAIDYAQNTGKEFFPKEGNITGSQLKLIGYDNSKELVTLAQNRGFFTGKGIDSSELSHKLADTINLEIIEPVARVYRAYRFAKKHPQCDRYVMCLVNQIQPDETLSLPGLKAVLSRSTSLFASWFLSGYTGTSFWSLYQTITEENNCQSRFVDSCNEFHIEEIKVTTEYVHNEL